MINADLIEPVDNGDAWKIHVWSDKHPLVNLKIIRGVGEKTVLMKLNCYLERSHSVETKKDIDHFWTGSLSRFCVKKQFEGAIEKMRKMKGEDGKYLFKQD